MMNPNPFKASAAAPQYYYYPMAPQTSGAPTMQATAAGGAPNVMPAGMPAAMPSGMPTGMPTGMPSAMSGGMPTMLTGGMPGGTPSGIPAFPGAPSAPPMLPIEQSFIENILRLNLGKMVTLYMTYENNSEWNAKIFRGVLEAAGRDHIIISDPKTGMRYLLLMVNLDYATFDEPLNYSYPFR